MPVWYYEKKELRNTPSALEGIDYETECRYRKEGARFIIDTGTKMDLGYNTMATGVVYFHRFYMYHSFRNFPRYVTACCCLFLAGKVEETPKKCKDIIKTARGLLTDQKFAMFGEDPKEEVMTLERILLQTIKFDLQVDHPYSFLLKYAKCLKGDKAKLHKMVQMAWTFVNDSLCTTLCLQWEPEIIAVALMYLAGKLSKFEVVDWVGRMPKHLRWWDMFIEDVTMDLLEDICHQVLDLYSHPQTTPAPDSPPLVRTAGPLIVTAASIAGLVKKEQPSPVVVPLTVPVMPTTPGVVPSSHTGMVPSQTPVKTIKADLKQSSVITTNGEKMNIVPVIGEKPPPVASLLEPQSMPSHSAAATGAVIPTTYQYQSTGHGHSVPPPYTGPGGPPGQPPPGFSQSGYPGAPPPQSYAGPPGYPPPGYPPTPAASNSHGQYYSTTGTASSSRPPPPYYPP